ncbi:MAG: hypothetical protein HGA37_10390 [Lentimicrobium sp.]|nr:hypothetical protein [Lentimicrobium sp.]
MKINRLNYEEFAISYLDGTLDPVDAAELLLFLEQNPDLKDEFHELDQISLKADTDIQYNLKELLLQPADVDAINISTDNYNFYFIAASEGDLSEKGMLAVKQFISNHPELKPVLEIFTALKLVADPGIRFPDTVKLRKSTLVKSSIKYLIFAGSAAASILLLISLFLRLEPQPAGPMISDLGGYEVPLDTAIKKDSVTIEKPLILKSGKATESIQRDLKTSKSISGKPVNKEPARNERENMPIHYAPPRQILNITPEPFNSSSRNFYSELFDEIVQSQEAMMANLEPTQQSLPEQAPAKSKINQRMGRIIQSGAQIASRIPQSGGGWMLADIGIEGINMLTDNDLKLQRIAKPDGQTEKIIITEDGSGYAFSRNQN